MCEGVTLRVQCQAHDTSLVLPCLKMRVREAEEDLGKLTSFEEVGEEFHRVCADAGDVLVCTRIQFCVLCTQSLDFRLDKLRHRGSDLHAYATGQWGGLVYR